MTPDSMKKMSLLALGSDKPRLMRAMQRLGCVQIVAGAPREGPSPVEAERARLLDVARQVERLDLCIRRLSPFDQHGRSAPVARRAVGGDQLASAMASRREAMDALERAEAIERSRGELRAREARIRLQIERLAPWEDLAVPLDRLGNTKTCELLLLCVPARSFAAFERDAGALGALEIEIVSRTEREVNALLAAHAQAADALDSLIGQSGARRVRFEDMSGTAALLLDQLRGQLRRIDEVREQLSGELVGLADQLPVLRVLRDVDALARDRLDAQLLAENTKSAFLLTGWVPQRDVARLEGELRRVAPLCELEFADPGEGETPPALMRNGGFARKFGAIARMFSASGSGGRDFAPLTDDTRYVDIRDDETPADAPPVGVSLDPRRS